MFLRKIGFSQSRQKHAAGLIVFRLSWVGTRGAGYTVGTGAIKENLMPGRPEALWGLRCYQRRASPKVKNLATGIAMEVIMMSLARNLVAGCLTGNLYRLQPFLFHQILDVPIDRGNSEAAMMKPGGFQSLVRRQRPICIEECLTNRRLLFCIALLHR